MKSPKVVRHPIIIFIALFIFFIGQPKEFGKDTTFFHGFPIKKPIIRVSLGINLTDIQVSSSGGMKVYEVKPDYRLLADDVQEVFIKGRQEKLSEKFLIQVFRTEDEREAQRFAQTLRSQLEVKVYVRPVRGKERLFQVLVGDFMTRGDALKFIRVLLDHGYKEAWIITEDISDHHSRPLWILVGEELKSLNEETTLYFIPSHPRSFLSFRGRSYRGIFVLQSSRKGLVLINILNLEDYLKSVVPSELSPYNFPALEAHKAQAVAARTYALKNKGQMAGLGYDLGDTPLDQFYKGMNAEHPLSTRAVEETKGEVLTYRGRLIDALYTSTCGGRTEDVENIFLGPALPYLRSTECFYEKQKEWLVSSSFNLPPIFVQGRDSRPAVAELMALGVLSLEKKEISWYSQNIDEMEAQSWLEKAVKALGREFPESFASLSPQPLTWGRLGQLVGLAFRLEERVKELYPQTEQSYLIDKFPGWPEEARPFLVYLAPSGFLDFNQPEGLSPDETVTRGELALVVAQILSQEGDYWQTGVFLRQEGEALVVRAEESDQEISLPLQEEVILLEKRPESRRVVTHLHLLGGEKIRWIARDGQPSLYEFYLPFPSNVLDRTSPYRMWQVRLGREELSRRINRFYPVGELIDLLPLRRGASNRVIELLIKGSATEVRVKGLRIRRVLGLRDTLFIIDREYDPNGQIQAFVFTGRGWGHGVGLCQVGAYGLALSGANYREILKKYYHGVKITRLYK